MKFWLIALSLIVFLLASCTTYVQSKRQAFILACLGISGQLYSFSVLLASIFIPLQTTYSDFSLVTKIICGLSGFIVSVVQVATFTISLALSIELHQRLRLKKKCGTKLRWLFRVLCLVVPLLSVALDIAVVLASGSRPFMSLKSVGVCEVKSTVSWASFVVRGIPEYLSVIPAFILSFLAIIPLVFKLFKEGPSTAMATTSPSNPLQDFSQCINTIPTHDNKRCSSTSTSNTSTVQQSDRPSSSSNKQIMKRSTAFRMSIWCVIVSFVGIPRSVMGMNLYIHAILNHQSGFQNPIAAMTQLILGLVVHSLIFLVFATGHSAFEQYKKLIRDIWKCEWKRRRHSPLLLEPQKIITHQRIIPNQIEIVERTTPQSLPTSITNRKPPNDDNNDKNSKKDQGVKKKSLSISSLYDGNPPENQTHCKSLATLRYPSFPSSSHFYPSPYTQPDPEDLPRFPSAFELSSSTPLSPISRSFSLKTSTLPTKSSSSPRQSLKGEPIISRKESVRRESSSGVSHTVSSEGDNDETIEKEEKDQRTDSTPSSRRMSSSHDRHSWLTKPPVRSLGSDGIIEEDTW